jgi:pimeloyl-ACP methyl ester carboxylesterase
MTLPGLVLVHGGAHAADCWDLTVDEMHRLAPELDVLAVDLPGRRGKAGDLRTLTIGHCLDSVVADIEDAGLDKIVIVAHSMGGLTVPGVVAKLGADRVREMILATAYVPPEGRAVADTLTGPLARLARYGARRGKPGEMSVMAASLAFLNGVPRARRRWMLDRLCAESPQMVVQNISRSDFPDEVPRTWILTTRDRSLSVKSQRRSIEALGGVQTVIEIDTCHDLMVSEPERLAEILIERCSLYKT